MGQRISLADGGRPHHRSSKRTNDIKQSFSVMEFASIWLGGLDFSAVPLPTGWDELLDWAEHASEISAAIENVDSPVIQEHGVIQIVPYVLSSARKQLDCLPSLPYIDRATFYAESVIIQFEMRTPSNKQHEEISARILSVRDFSKYYTLLRRLSDLMALEQRGGELVFFQNDDDSLVLKASQLTDCVICCNEVSNSILPCNHRICESCERKWVRKRLECPFCRTKFKNVKQIRNCAWHLTEFSESELQNDISSLYCQLESFWRGCRFGTATKDLMGAYEQVDRCIVISEEHDDLVVTNDG